MTHAAGNINAYLRTKAHTASPEELRLMLLDGAIKFARQGREGLAAKNYESVYNGFSRARDIILELINSMRPEVDPELCKKVAGLYTFMYMELIEASFNKDIARADKVIELLEFERETWVLVMEKVAAERAESQSVRAAVREAAQFAPDAGHTPISVQA